MRGRLFEAAVRTAEKVNAAKAIEEVAWREWLASDTAENKATFLAARTAWLQATREWRMAAHEAETVVKLAGAKNRQLEKVR